MDDLTEVGKLIDALRPWIHQVVIIGGWAHRLYRFHELAEQPSYVPVTTRDADIAFSLNEPLGGDIDAALKKAGFEVDLRGDRTPPVSHYHFGKDDRGFYAEFLVPLIGSRIDRKGRSVPLTVEKAGVRAQKLRHVDVLLIAPWTVVVNADFGFELERPAQVLIPNAVTFIAQRILIKHKREGSKQPQDVLYIHDTLDMFGNRLDQLRSIWLDVVRPKLSSRTANDIERLIVEQYGKVSDTHREAVRIPQDRLVSPNDLQQACLYGLSEVFGAK